MAKHGTRSRYVQGCKCPECRAANAAYHKKYYHGARSGKGEAWNRTKTRDFIRKYKVEEGCADCGYNSTADALELDHLPGETKISNVTSISSFPKLLVELAKCEVVCANCHRIRTHTRMREGDKGT